ncbi:hypothetical protein [Pseudonocardia sp. H11422]|uniref:hypothetical protein n=1 Tax=Pseudonocardia sp. H11422 TaxID=2835866 RepID=UPI001BDC87BD|nr:hypothetical protein [Pseudonocardia sp. H11422]
MLRAADQSAALRSVVDSGVRLRLVAAIRAAARLPERILGYPAEVELCGGDGAGLYVLGTAADTPLCRLRAGEAASAVLLLATELGLATSLLSRPLEVGGTRMMVRDEVLGGALCPQLVLRIGWAPRGCTPPPTPRRPVDEVFTHLAL